MTEPEKYPLAQIDFEAIRRTAETLGYSKKIGSRIERVFGWVELKTYGDLVNYYLELKRTEIKAEKREERRFHRVYPRGCERMIGAMGFGRLAAKVMNEHLREVGINLE